VLNAANEVAVGAFLAGRIGFLDISSIVERALESVASPPVTDMENVLAVDTEARRCTRDLIAKGRSTSVGGS
jgi:1-deoxy-D-xylulose-5-phosphate reductoisomerase